MHNSPNRAAGIHSLVSRKVYASQINIGDTRIDLVTMYGKHNVQYVWTDDAAATSTMILINTGRHRHPNNKIIIESFIIDATSSVAIVASRLSRRRFCSYCRRTEQNININNSTYCIRVRIRHRSFSMSLLENRHATGYFFYYTYTAIIAGVRDCIDVSLIYREFVWISIALLYIVIVIGAKRTSQGRKDRRSATDSISFRKKREVAHGCC